MKPILALLLALALLPAAASAGPAPEAKALAALLPGDGAAPGWNKSAPPDFYGPENLWDCINGAAALYLDYGFKALVAQFYTNATGDRKSTAQIEIYRMETPLHAFAIYAAERTPEDDFIKIGAEGYLSDGALNFWKGPYYTKVSAYSTAEPSEQILRTLAAIVADRIPGEQSEPEAFRMFPSEHRIEKSERYIPKNFMGHPFFRSGYRVDYQDGNREYQLFLVPNDSTKQAEEAFNKYREHLASQGKPVTLDKQPDHQTLTAADRQTVFQYESFVGGVLDAADNAHARELQTEMLTRLKTTHPDTK